MYARIIDGQVVELIDDAFGEDGALIPIELRFHPDFVATLVATTGGVVEGDLYDGQAFSKPQPAAPQVPESVSKRQAVLALYDAGKWDAFNAAVDAAGPRARLEWEATTVVDRSNPLVAQLAPALGLDLDALFATAAAL